MELVIKKNKTVLEYAGLFYTFAIAFSSSTGNILVKLSRLVIVAAFAMEVFSRSGKIKKLPKEYCRWLIAFFAVGCLSVVWAVSKTHVISSSMTQMYVVIVNLILLYALAKNDEYVFSLMKVTMVSSIMHGLNIFLRHGFFVYLNSRGGTTFENANTLAYVASFAFVFGHILLTQKKTKNVVAYQLLTMINLLFALLTASKKIFLFIGIYLLIYYIFTARNPLKMIRNILITFFAGIIVCIMAFKVDFLYRMIGSRFETMLSGLLGGATDGSTGFRINLIRWGIDWFSQRPILGYGLDCYKSLLGSTYDTWVGTEGVYAHNNYIELLVDVGIVGTAVYYSLYVSMLKKAIKLRKQSRMAVCAGAIVFMLLVTEFAQITYSVAFIQEVLLMVWFVLYRLIKEQQETLAGNDYGKQQG